MEGREGHDRNESERAAGQTQRAEGPYFYLSLSSLMTPEDGDSVQSIVAAQNSGSFFFQNIRMLRLRLKYERDRKEATSGGVRGEQYITAN